MKEGILFEVTRDHLENGLRGVPVGFCVTSQVDPQKGLSYVGRSVADLSFRDPVEVIYLLYYGEAGSSEQIAQFQAELGRRSKCKEETIRAIAALPKEGQAMDVFAAAILIAGMFEGTGDYREDCLNVIAKLPEIAAVVINCHAGWGNILPSQMELGYVENFAHMLSLPEGKSDALISALRLFFVFNFDHGGGNLSAFVGKTVASGLENMYGSLAASMTALAGPKHGRANQECLQFVRSVLEQVGENPTAQGVAQCLRSKLEYKEGIFGFGSSILKQEDPRASICYQYCQKHFPDHPLIKTACLLRQEAPRILKENAILADPHPNIEAITGTLLTVAGFPYLEYFTVLLGLARCVGIAIQIAYERLDAREGKGTPMIRPTYLYRHRI